MQPKKNDSTSSNNQVYEIRLQGQLEARWEAWFDGLAITQDPDGNTLLSGPLADQAALHGVLKKVRDLGLPLLSVNPVQINRTDVNKEK